MHMCSAECECPYRETTPAPLYLDTVFFAGPTAPERPQAFCKVVVWEEPESPNGALVKYVVKYNLDGREVSNDVSGERNSFVFPTAPPSGTAIRVCVVTLMLKTSTFLPMKHEWMSFLILL